MRTKLFLLVALAWIGLNATAQRTERRLDHVEPRTVQVFDHQDVSQKFRSHWFLNLQGGAQYTQTDAKFKNLISPNVQAAVGYQFTPVFGMRLAANGWQSKGAFDEEVYSFSSRMPTTDGKYKFNYVGANLDFMFNLSNLFCGWNPDRFLNVIAFAGGGANIAWGNDEAHKVKDEGYLLENIWCGTKKRSTARAGLQLDFRLSQAVGLLLEGNANVVSDYYNSKQSGNADWYFNALAGVKINLGQTYTTRQVKGCEPRIVEKVVEKIVEKPVYIDKIVEVEKKPEPLRRDVFFTINSTRIDPTETQKIQDVVNYLNANPNAKVTITGYADKGTGNAQINERLGKNRAKVVTDRLVKQFKIDPARITTDSKGDTEQPFAENDKNRVSICIAE